MAEINTPIPVQKFEQIRDRIAFIIADELSNQASLKADSELEVTVWTERFVAFDKTELPAIKVYLASGTFDQETPITNESKYQFNIDVYTKGSALSIDTKNLGDYYAVLYQHKLVGNLIAILQSPYYVKLGFNPEFGIKNRQITDVKMFEPEERKGDATHSYSGRIVLTVNVVEEVTQINTMAAELPQTSIKIGETDQGYRIEL
jgi:hypothetical protein